MLDLSLKFYWQEVDPDYSMCKVCDNMLTDKMFQGTVEVAGKPNLINYKICEACKIELEKSEKLKKE